MILLRAVTAGLLLFSLACTGSDGDPVGYCDIKPIFEESCERCHGTTLSFGAPISLTNYDEVYKHRSTIKVHVATEFMPYMGSDISPPVSKLTKDEKALIIEWVDDGAHDCP